MKAAIILLCCLCLGLPGLAAAGQPAATAPASTAAPAGQPQVMTIFGVERSAREDAIHLLNQDLLRGEVLEEALTILTPYGLLRVPVRRCAGLSFEGPGLPCQNACDETIVTVNSNRITGLVADRAVRFRVASTGQTLSIRKDRIRLILLQNRPGEMGFLAKAGPSDLFVMANGDILSGRAAAGRITIRADGRSVPVAFGEIKQAIFQGAEPVVAVITRTGGQVVQGELETEELSLELDIGIRVDGVYRNRFAAIHVGTAQALAPVLLAAVRPAAGGPASSPAGAGAGQTIALDLGDRVMMKLALIPAGKFAMGSPDNELDRQEDEGPQREVALSAPFYMGIYEVTQEQYQAVTGSNPSSFKDPAKPVENVSYDDAVEFCRRLSQKTQKTQETQKTQKTGRAVTLPTEAQWEYACRAGTRTRFCFGDDEKELGDFARFGQGGELGTVPVGQKKPNAWGLYDMHGNVWEWCLEWYAGSYVSAPADDPVGPSSGQYRVLRGGGWRDSAASCRSAERRRVVPDYRYSDFGFRVVVIGRGSDSN